jgi:hypothetical protein
MLQKSQGQAPVLRKTGGGQCVCLHVVHIDRRPVGYNDFAVDTGFFCNMKGWGSTYDKAVDHGVVECGNS